MHLNATAADVCTHTFAFVHTFRETLGDSRLMWKFSKPPINIFVKTLSPSGRTRLCVVLHVSASEMFLW